MVTDTTPIPLPHRPAAIRASNALIMDVVASKGLEFDDVILVDFLSSSPDAKHWRVLLSYLRNELETHASVKAEQEAVAALEAEYGGDAAVMINGLIAGQHSRRKLLEDVPLLQVGLVLGRSVAVLTPDINHGSAAVTMRQCTSCAVPKMLIT